MPEEKSPAAQFGFGLHQGGDIRHHADVAAVGQGRGADIDGGAVGAYPAAHLRAGDIVRHLFGEHRVRGALAVLAGFGAPADDVGERVADVQGCAFHHSIIRVVEHRDPAVGTVDANAMRHVQQHKVEQAGAFADFVLGSGLRCDVVD